MRKIVVIYMIVSTFILLLINNQEKKISYPIAKLNSSLLEISFFANKKNELINSFKEKDLAYMGLGFFWGIKNKIPKKIIKLHKKLNLVHLMTPSGLHFSSLYFMSGLFLVQKSYQLLICLLLIVGLSMVPDFYALKRIILLRGLTLFSYIKLPEISKNIILGTVFIIDFLWGSFSKNPVGHSFSLLFLAGIYFSKNKGMSLLTIIVGQIVINSLYHQQINLLGILWGMLITLFFTFLFPILLLLFMISCYSILEYCLKMYLSLIEIVSKYTFDFLTIKLSFVDVVLLFLFIYFFIMLKNKFIKKNILISFFLLFFLKIDNLEFVEGKLDVRRYKENTPLSSLFYIKKKKITPEGLRLEFIDKKKCSLKLKDFYYEIHCRMGDQTKF